MIKFSDGELLNIMPVEFKRQPEVAALSYALKQAYRDFAIYQARAYVYALIDSCNEDVLDMLAVELRIRYYEGSFDIAKKRTLIKSAIFVSLKDGTKYAVDSVIKTAIGVGESQDWFEYGGTPGHFRVDLEMDTYDIDKLNAAIQMVKRASAHIDGIGLITGTEQNLFYGMILQAHEMVSIGCDPVDYSEDDIYLDDEHGNRLLDERRVRLLD